MAPCTSMALCRGAGGSLGCGFYWETHFCQPRICIFDPPCLLRTKQSFTGAMVLPGKDPQGQPGQQGTSGPSFPSDFRAPARSWFVPEKWEWSAGVGMHCCWDNWQLPGSFFLVSSPWRRVRRQFAPCTSLTISPAAEAILCIYWIFPVHAWWPESRVVSFPKRLGSRIWREEHVACFSAQMFAKYVQLSPFPSFLNSNPAPSNHSFLHSPCSRWFPVKIHFCVCCT